MYLNIPDCHTIPLVQFWKMIRRTNRLEDWVMHWPPGNNNNNENNNIIIRQTTHAIGCHKCHIVVAFLPSIVALWLVEYKDRGKFQVLQSGIVNFFALVVKFSSIVGKIKLKYWHMMYCTQIPNTCSSWIVERT